MHEEPRESFVEANKDPLIDFLNRLVVISVKFLAILMVLVIMWSVVDVVVHIYRHFSDAVTSLFSFDDLITTLGAFLAVMIAIEIFLNIVFYLKKDAIHVPLVLATALTAAARKVIIMDYTVVTALTIIGLAGIIFALGVCYWLITKKTLER